MNSQVYCGKVIDDQYQKAKQLLETGYFCPSWWVKSAEAVQVQSNEISWYDRLNLGMSPPFSQDQIFSLPLIFSHLQDSLFKNPESMQVDLYPDRLEKDAGIHTIDKRKSFKSLLYGLGGMKIYEHSGSEIFTHSLFSGEIWHENNAETRFTLNLTPLSRELIFGYTDSHQNLSRLSQGIFSIDQFLANLPPLQMRRSIWHELKGLESILLLRMEKAGQWLHKGLDLNGVYGESFEQLFKGVAIKSKKNYPSSLLQMKIKLLRKFVCKLQGHGMLKPVLIDDFLAFSDHSIELMWIWKLARQSIYSLDSLGYQEAVHRNLMRVNGIKDFQKSWESLLCRKLGYIISSSFENYRKKYHHLDIHVDNESKGQSYCVINSNTIFSWQNLFWEWILRREEGFPKPIPESFKHLDAWQCIPCLKDDNQDLRTSYHHFLTAIWGNESLYRQLVSHEPLFSLASKVSWGKLTDVFNSHKVSEEVEHGIQDFNSGSKSEERSILSNSGASFSKVPSSKISAPIEERIKIKNAQKRLDKQLNPDLLVEGQERSAILKNLQKMKASSQKAYTDLCSKYLVSLDQSSRQMILDIKNRMNSDVFELHLQHRLVRFVSLDPSLIDVNYKKSLNNKIMRAKIMPPDASI